MAERDPQIDKAARTAQQQGLGKLLPRALYIHKTYVKELPAQLRGQVAKAHKLGKGKLGGYNIVKIGLDGRAVSFLEYPGFDAEPHPSLARAALVKMGTGKVQVTDYEGRESPPILHRKESFVQPGYPGYTRFEALTASEEAHDLLERVDIGSKAAWEKLLRSKGLTIRGDTVMAKNPALKKAATKAKATSRLRKRSSRSNPAGLNASQKKILEAMANDADPLGGPLSVVQYELEKYWGLKLTKYMLKKELDALVTKKLVRRHKNVSTGAWTYYATDAGVNKGAAIEKRRKAPKKAKSKARSKPKGKFDPLKAIMGQDPYSNPESYPAPDNVVRLAGLVVDELKAAGFRAARAAQGGRTDMEVYFEAVRKGKVGFGHIRLAPLSGNVVKYIIAGSFGWSSELLDEGDVSGAGRASAKTIVGKAKAAGLASSVRPKPAKRVAAQKKGIFGSLFANPEVTDSQLEEGVRLLTQEHKRTGRALEFDYPDALANYFDDLSVWESTIVGKSPRGKMWWRVTTNDPDTLHGILVSGIDRSSEFEAGTGFAIKNANKRRGARRKLVEAVQQITMQLARKPAKRKRRAKAGSRKGHLRSVQNPNGRSGSPKLQKATSRAKATSRLAKPKAPKRRRKAPAKRPAVAPGLRLVANARKGISEMVAKHDADQLKRMGWKSVSVGQSPYGKGAWGVTLKPWKKDRAGKIFQVEIFALFEPTNGGVKVKIIELVANRDKVVWTGKFSNPNQAAGITSAKIRKAAGYYRTKRGAQGLAPKRGAGERAASWLGLANPSAKQTKDFMQPVIDVYRAEKAKAANVYPELHYVKLQMDESIHDSPRHFAQATIDRGQLSIQVAPELAMEPVSVIRGIIRHEFGHAAVMAGLFKPPAKATKGLTMYDTRERQADRVAESIFGTKIYYDKRGVEVSGPGARGQRPRPKGLK